MNTINPCAWLGSLLLLVSCGGSPPPTSDPVGTPAPDTAAAPTADGEPAAEEPPAAPAAWSDDLSKKEKGAFMKAHVLPTMKSVFQEADAERYASFDCKTCHGSEWKDHPQDVLPKLTMKDGAFDVPEEKKPVVEFMMKRVVPEMAPLFGEQPFNPETKQGFGCGGCHVVEM